MSDLISRQAAVTIPILPKEHREYQTMNLDDAYELGWFDYQKCIEDLPSAQPEPQWIPCSERLPEKSNMYTVTDSKGDVVRFVFTGTESSKEYWRRCAKAWMPLPEPYRGGQE